MQFTVPKFIENKPKIIGPLTFKQFVFVGTAGGICLFLYFIIPISLFIIITIFLLGGAFALAFIKIGKDPLPVVIRNLLVYNFNPKIYLWKKEIGTPKTIILKKKEKIPAFIKNQEDKKTELKVTRNSKLDRLLTKIATKNK
ncbi:MAG: PrgI family protein [Candidatus Nealsonbacteria bacterium]